MSGLLFLLLTLESPPLARPELPTLPDTLLIREWTITGPFPAAPREGAVCGIPDPLAFWPDLGDTFRTSLTQGGIAICRRVQADSLGWLQTDYGDVRWDTIQDYLGVAGLLNTGFACADFPCSAACRALAVATKLGGFSLNGRSYIGDIYGNGWFLTPVLLDSGINRVMLRLSGYGDQRARFMLIPPQSPVQPVLADVTAPDLLPDSTMQVWLGIPLLNTTNHRLDTVVLTLLLDSLCLGTATVPSVPALGGVKHPILVRIPAAPEDSSGLKLVLKTTWRSFSRFDTLILKYRQPDQPHRCTFLSAIDSSCQYYGILYPRDFNPSRRYSLILALHGAGVEAADLTRCYRPRQWTFVITPTNRRPYGFDWQDWGRLDALEVLNLGLTRLPVDPDRVYLTGHSMGGHGTWHISTLHPDRFAAASPQAGWPTHQLYVPWFLQRSAMLAEPELLAIRDQVLRSDNVPALLINCVNLPFFIVHGGDDDNVPPIHGRNLAAMLAELGIDHRYREVPGHRHWWNWNDTTPCVDYEEMMEFFRRHVRQTGPHHVRFRTPDLGTTRRAYWVAIDRVATVGYDAEIEATAGESLITVRTTNVSQFTLELDGRLFFRSSVKVVIDGKLTGRRYPLPAVLTFHKSGDRWHEGTAPAAPLSKNPQLYGPVRQALMSPFALVYGTLSPSTTDQLRHAATQEALRWWLIANGNTTVLADTEVTSHISSSRNLILYGSPADNSLTRRLARHLPIGVRAGRMQLTNYYDLGDSLAAIFVYPNPLNTKRLILVRMGTDSASTRVALSWNIIGSATGIPDFIIFDRSIQNLGWAGVRAAGFFDTGWRFEPTSAYLRR